jgi:hypothetical protein
MHCDNCGIEALESQEFSEKRIIFRKTKHYCDACHRKSYLRSLGFWLFIILLVASLEVYEANRAQTRILDRTGVWLLFFFVFHIVIIVPHELGHAFTAQALGYRNIRILVGSGRMVFTFRIFGFPMFFNRIPLGGLTLFNFPSKAETWKTLAIIAAGPLVSLVIIAVVTPFLTWRGFFDGIATWPELIFWSNGAVLLQNLFPYSASTAFGIMPNDGLLLWRLLSGKNKSINRGPQRIPLYELILCHTLKWFILLITSTTCILLAACAIWSLLGTPRPGAADLRFIGCLVLSVLSVIVGWFTVRIFRNPITALREPVHGLSAIAFTPDQMALAKQGNEEFARKDFATAEETFERAMGLVEDRNSNEFAQLYLAKLKTCIHCGEIERAEQMCLAFVAEDIHKEQKMRVLDGFACLLLYQLSSPCLLQAERIARKSLELVPGQPTLKGTLGGVLTELSKFSEAEPLLKECLERSHAIHDQAISSFYLGWINLACGNASEGERLIKYATLLLPEPWLIAKGRNLLDKAKATTA